MRRNWPTENTERIKNMAFWQKRRNWKYPGNSLHLHGSLIMSSKQRKTMEGRRNPQAEAAGSTLLVGGPGNGRS